MDTKEIAFNPAVELSYLKPDEQERFLDAMDYSQATPSLSQAQRIKKLSQAGECTQNAMYKVMSEEKKDELDRITLKSDTLRKYFPRSYTPMQCRRYYQAAGTVAEKETARKRIAEKRSVKIMRTQISHQGDITQLQQSCTLRA